MPPKRPAPRLGLQLPWVSSLSFPSRRGSRALPASPGGRRGACPPRTPHHGALHPGSVRPGPVLQLHSSRRPRLRLFPHLLPEAILA